VARRPVGDESSSGQRRTAREAGQDAVARAQETAERARLTFRRLSGLDRSGPPPPQTLPGQPLNPWTIPNAIGFVRLALLPVFLAFAFASGDGISRTAVIIYAVVAWSDYLDGIAARVTGQYSRLGTLLDPLVDRLLVISGVAVCWPGGDCVAASTAPSTGSAGPASGP
jgi:cardiolipin synthase